jgi:hypothetical protein
VTKNRYGCMAIKNGEYVQEITRTSDVAIPALTSHRKRGEGGAPIQKRQRARPNL